MFKRYIGSRYWYYRLPDGTKGSLEITGPLGNRKKDTEFAKYFLRKKLGIKRLPNGTKVWPTSDGH